MLITPKNAIQIVLERKAKGTRFKVYETTLQKWTFFLAVGLLLTGAIIASTTYFWRNSYIAIVGLIALFGAMLAAGAYQIASVLPELAKLRNVEKEASIPLLTQFNDDIDLINELSQTCEAHHLSYARERFILMARQLRERISLLVGAIEKVGIIPLAATAYISFAKAQKEGLVVFGEVEWTFAIFIFLYLIALRLSSAAQWMELAAGIYEQAIALKMKRSSTPAFDHA